MPNCHEMKNGEIYKCQDCDIELQVIKECKNRDIPSEECSCRSNTDECIISCCGNPLVKKE